MIARIGLPLLATLALAACNPKPPEAQAVHPMLSGQWRLANAKEDCSGPTLRFDRKRLVQSSKNREINVLDVLSMEIQGSSIEIEFAPSARMMLAARSAEKVEELSQTTITITLAVSGDSISLRDVQMRDPKKGLQAPTGSKRQQMAKMFELRRCAGTAGA